MAEHVRSMKAPTGKWGLISLALFLGARGITPRVPVQLPAFEKPVAETYALQDTAMVLNGLRRWGADLAYIQLLQYYSSRREEAEKMFPHDHPSRIEEDHNHPLSEQAYAHLATFARRGGSLDPYFHFIYLYVGSVLGFNLNRTEDALAVLEEASRLDPRFWQYRLYAGAIGFKKSDQWEKAVPLLENAIQDPDCPSMVFNILGNIYKKHGELQRAADVFWLMAEKGGDPDYVNTALDKLRELRNQYGVLPSALKKP